MKHLGQVHSRKIRSAIQKSEHIHVMLPLVSELINFLLKHCLCLLKCLALADVKNSLKDMVYFEICIVFSVS